MEKEKLFKYFRKMLSEIKNEESIYIGRNVGINIENPEINYIRLELQNIPKCILQKAKREILLGNKFADVEISEDEFNILAEEALDKLKEVQKMQVAIMEQFVENF